MNSLAELTVHALPQHLGPEVKLRLNLLFDKQVVNRLSHMRSTLPRRFRACIVGSKQDKRIMATTIIASFI